MRIQQFEDDTIERAATANIDAFFADLAADPQQSELAKRLQEDRQSEENDHAWHQLTEDFELRAAGVDPGHTPRLRSDNRPDPDLDDDDGDELHKRAGGSSDHGSVYERGEPGTKKIHGDWVHEFDQSGNVFRAYHKSVDGAVFARTE